MRFRPAVIVAILVALAAGRPAPAAPTPPLPTASEAVQAALRAQEEAWNRGDLAGFLAGYLQSPELTSSAGGQFVKGFDALRRRYEQSYAGNAATMGTLRYEDVALSELGPDHALSTGRFRVTRDGKVAAEGAFTLVWAKTPQGWRIVHDHRTSVAAGAAPASPAGLVVEELVKGSGEAAMAGLRLTVHYTGWLQGGQKFDSSLDRGQPFEFVLGQRRVIPGWEQGVAGMRVGGKRRLTIPPELAYGARGAGGVIPPNATLIFEVELLGVGRP